MNKDNKDIRIPDIDAEWKQFRSEYIAPASPRRRLWPRVAASATIVLVVGAIAIAALFPETRTFLHEHCFGERVSEEPILPEEANDFIFESATLREIMLQIGDHYRKPVRFLNSEGQDLHIHFRYSPTEPLDDVIRMLNHFSDISITLKSDTLVVE